jgi:hypothetical protein
MPDSFFATKTRKRKRVTLKDSGPSSSKKVLKTSNGRISANGKGKSRAADEELEGSGSEALDDLDLRADEVDPNESGEEDAGETPAEKRLRLAKLYLESIREDLGASLPSVHTAMVFLTLLSCTISGWGGRRGGNRQRADLCSPQAGCPRTCGQVTHICGRLREYFSKSMIATCACVCQLLIPL